MSGSSIRARDPHGAPRAAAIQRDPDIVASFLEDAAHFPGGRASGVLAASSEADIAAALRSGSSILPVGAQSSLTGGATPMGELVISTSRMNRIVEIGEHSVRVQPGVTLAELDAALSRAGRYYPPAPTFAGAFAGGTIATNAAGAATFKYGTTRDWVRAITVVLSCGEVLDIERGATRAHPDGHFDIILTDRRTIRVPVPSYQMPSLPKLSAGYFARPSMDLIDLFIGSEGTLGVLTEATLAVLPVRPVTCLAFVPFPSRANAMAFVRRLRDAAIQTWRTRDTAGLDVSAIEYMDARCLSLLREDGMDRMCRVALPADSAIGLLITLEVPAGTTADSAYEQIGRAQDSDPPDTPLVRFCRLLAEFGAIDDVQLAVPGDRTRTEQLLAIREAVPAAVNERVGRAKHSIDQRIEKTAADMIVPFERLNETLDSYDEVFGRRGLDVAVWGHVSDGNLHPNVIPRSFADVEAGKAAIRELGREAIERGGAPLAEHGVGRNAVKQELLADLYGEDGIEQMRAVKRALDPQWTLAPGVLFSRSGR